MLVMVVVVVVVVLLVMLVMVVGLVKPAPSGVVCALSSTDFMKLGVRLQRSDGGV